MYPDWLGQLSEQELEFLQGHNIESDDINAAVEFYYNRITQLKQEIVTMKRPYYEVMFELSYIIQNNESII